MRQLTYYCFFLTRYIQLHSSTHLYSKKVFHFPDDKCELIFLKIYCKARGIYIIEHRGIQVLTSPPPPPYSRGEGGGRYTARMYKTFLPKSFLHAASSLQWVSNWSCTLAVWRRRLLVLSRRPSLKPSVSGDVIESCNEINRWLGVSTWVLGCVARGYWAV